jgi:hypothetical protein
MNRPEKQPKNVNVRRRRSDAGVDNDRPIALRLKPEERQTIAALADADNRSMAAICRLAVLAGLPKLKLQISKGD